MAADGVVGSSDAETLALRQCSVRLLRIESIESGRSPRGKSKHRSGSARANKMKAKCEHIVVKQELDVEYSPPRWDTRTERDLKTECDVNEVMIKQELDIGPLMLQQPQTTSQAQKDELIMTTRDEQNKLKIKQELEPTLLMPQIMATSPPPPVQAARDLATPVEACRGPCSECPTARVGLSSDEERIAVCAAAVVLFSGQHLINWGKKKRKKRRWWMSSFNKSRSRYNATDMPSAVGREPSTEFENFDRMSRDDFAYLLNKIGPHIAKNNTNMRQSVPIQDRLAIALRFLATGDSYKNLSYSFKVSKQTVSRCVDDVCKAITQEMAEEIKMPGSSHEWLKIAEEYDRKWNFPHCLGALDAKHVVIQNPFYNTSKYINYQGMFSILLLALVDPDYNFIVVDCGCHGRISDDGVFSNTEFYKKLGRSELDLPLPQSLPLKEEEIPYVFIADSTFALTTNIMTPYAGNHSVGTKETVFNYRLSRARQTVENAFGIMSSVFRVLRKPILLQADKVTNIVMTCVLLHNFLRGSKKSRLIYTPVDIFDVDHEGVIRPGSWRNGREGMSSLLPLRALPSLATVTAETIRDKFAEYFVTDGAVTWQNNY